MNLVGHIEYVVCITLQNIKMEKTHIDKIKQTVNIICEQNNLKQPLTVPSAGKLIAEYNGIDYAIELFENAYIECRETPNRDNPFAFAAYKATLETILYPMKK
jgi:hypothetical protein